ncbi:MAG: adenosylcobalamin-dependent ribonucleoside-diphosphate reductase [Dehalococcoidales bacterium]|nr:adenosylcobalamin-dependent ribonucleoside-diphosphate reductase [Dehalococcoidales bacterium]MDX9986339.1 adenosylcobalamin-dependent ribonucleoside-diphosphate reductase [Dehalococcoidales bacterium]
MIPNENAQYLLEKYYLDNASNETPEQLIRRVAKVLASTEIKNGGHRATLYWEETFYSLLSNMDFLPGSPFLLNAGKNSGQLASCHCIPVSSEENNYMASLEIAKSVQINGSGTAFNFSKLPSASNNNVSKSEAPVIQLLYKFSRVLGSFLQGGIRIGCNTAILSAHHPDIREFIQAKTDKQVLNNFYLTVSLTDLFMNSLLKKETYPLFDPISGQETGKIAAGDIFNAIVEASWNNGDPGVIFQDTIDASNPIPSLGQLEAVSGCGEQLMMEGECCFLGSINLVNMVHQNQLEVAEINWGKLKRTVCIALRLLDNAIDISTYASPEIEHVTKLGRKVGLGIMGLADLLYLLDIPYNSKKAMETTEQILKYIKKCAYFYSNHLGDQKGTCPVYQDGSQNTNRRNASITTIAPTGTISTIAGCSAGIEPAFRLVYLRRLADGKELLEVNPHFVNNIIREKLNVSLILRQLLSGKPLQEIGGVPEHIKKVFVTAQDISPEWHLNIQHSAQKHIDNAVSKTVNLDNNASRAEIRQIYLKAYKLGLKGITVYRDMSRENQPLVCSGEGLDLLNRWLKDKGF